MAQPGLEPRASLVKERRGVLLELAGLQLALSISKWGGGIYRYVIYFGL